MRKLLIIGAVTAQIVNHVKELPKGNEDVESLDESFRIAGGGYSNALVFQKIGFPYQLIACTGTGVYGEQCRQMLKDMNIEASHESDDVHGCQYVMVDSQGKRGLLSVDGCEYEFLLDDLQYIDPEEYDSVVVYAEMLRGENGDDLLFALEQLGLPVHFVIRENEEIDEDYLNAVLDLEPGLYLPRSQDMDIDALAEKCRSVMVFGNDGILYREKEDETRYPFTDIDEQVFIPAYLAALTAGADKGASASFAAYSDRETKHGSDLSNFTMERVKMQLIEAIRGKRYEKEI